MKKTLLAFAAVAATLTALPIAPVMAQPDPVNSPGYDRRDDDRRDGDRRGPDNRRDDSGPDRGPGDRGPGADRRGPPPANLYDANGRYREPRRIGRDSHIWRGRNGRYYCRRDNGTTGLLVGAGVGALAGHSIAGNGDRTLGALLGGVVGGALGRSIDRGDIRCR